MPSDSAMTVAQTGTWTDPTSPTWTADIPHSIEPESHNISSHRTVDPSDLAHAAGRLAHAVGVAYGDNYGRMGPPSTPSVLNDSRASSDEQRNTSFSASSSSRPLSSARTPSTSVGSLETWCDRCAIYLSTGSNLKRHKRTIHKVDTVYICVATDCGEEFDKIPSAQKHGRTAVGHECSTIERARQQ